MKLTRTIEIRVVECIGVKEDTIEHFEIEVIASNNEKAIAECKKLLKSYEPVKSKGYEMVLAKRVIRKFIDKYEMDLITFLEHAKRVERDTDT